MPRFKIFSGTDLQMQLILPRKMYVERHRPKTQGISNVVSQIFFKRNTTASKLFCIYTHSKLSNEEVTEMGGPNLEVFKVFLRSYV